MTEQEIMILSMFNNMLRTDKEKTKVRAVKYYRMVQDLGEFSLEFLDNLYDISCGYPFDRDLYYTLLSLDEIQK